MLIVDLAVSKLPGSSSCSGGFIFREKFLSKASLKIYARALTPL